MWCVPIDVVSTHVHPSNESHRSSNNNNNPAPPPPHTHTRHSTIHPHLHRSNRPTISQVLAASIVDRSLALNVADPGRLKTLRCVRAPPYVCISSCACACRSVSRTTRGANLTIAPSDHPADGPTYQHTCETHIRMWPDDWFQVLLVAPIFVLAFMWSVLLWINFYLPNSPTPPKTKKFTYAHVNAHSCTTPPPPKTTTPNNTTTPAPSTSSPCTKRSSRPRAAGCSSSSPSRPSAPCCCTWPWRRSATCTPWTKPWCVRRPNDPHTHTPPTHLTHSQTFQTNKQTTGQHPRQFPPLRRPLGPGTDGHGRHALLLPPHPHPADARGTWVG